MSWTSIVNQSRVKDLLAATLKRERLAHAYLFSGQAGSGKYATAIELAKVVNCEHSESEACGKCSDCSKFDSLQHPNVKLIFQLPVGKSEKAGEDPLAKLSDDEISIIREQIDLKARNPYHPISIPKANIIKVNSIREIRRESSLTAFGKGKKVFIIIDAETMNDESANAILKTLEEPHEDTLLILTTSNPDALLPTLVSRCQHIRFDSLSDDIIIEALQERNRIPPAQAKTIARLVNGNYSRALQYIDASFHERQEYAVELLRSMLFKSRRDLMSNIENIMSEYQKPDVRDMFRLMEQWLHDAMMLQQGIGSDTDSSDSESLKKFISVYPDWDYPLACESLERAVSLLDKNVYIPLIVLDLSARLKKHLGASSPIRTRVK
jgi:DNA polymerase-3 subunit delta'